jgi:hypothetical protein
MARSFGLLVTVIAIAIGIYLYSKQSQTIAESVPGGTLKSAPEIVGIRGDLLSIANAERSYIASEGKYASTIDELVNAHYLIIRGERPPYSYSIATSSSGFRVIATRSGEAGGPSEISIDETMQIQTSE